MRTVTKTVVATEIGPNEAATGVAFIHDIELDDTPIEVGQRVEVADGEDNLWPAVVESFTQSGTGRRWKLRLGA